MDNYNPMMQDIDLFIQRKNESYGDSIGKSSRMLEILCPTGIAVSVYHRAHILIRVLDKVSRLFSTGLTKDQALDAWRDIMGYAMKAAQLEEEHFES